MFRVGRNTFKQEDLDRQLAIPTLNDTPGVEVYSSEPRVHVANRKGPWQEVGSWCIGLSEIQTPAFEAFLNAAVAEFQQQVQRMQTKPEDVMPWKVNGERWHLGDKGFPPGKKVQWDRDAAASIAGHRPGRRAEASRFTGTIAPPSHLRIPGMTRAWAQWRTKEADMLVCRFIGKKGQFNLSQLEGFGIEPRLQDQREHEVTLLRFQNDDHLPASRLKEWMVQHLRGAGIKKPGRSAMRCPKIGDQRRAA